MTIPDLIGLSGVALLIVTYALLQLDRIDPKGFWYSFNNMIVAILVSVSLYYTWNTASVVIEVFWFLISVYGLVMYYNRKPEEYTKRYFYKMITYARHSLRSNTHNVICITSR